METIEQLRRDFLIAHNEAELAQINVERLSAKLDEISDAEPTREVYRALCKATDAARKRRDRLFVRRRAAAYKLMDTLMALGYPMTLSFDGKKF